MSISKKVGTLIAASVMGLGVLAIGEMFSVPGVSSIVTTAEARVGRPLTPVSVAGVARRTVRRVSLERSEFGTSRVPRWRESLRSKEFEISAFKVKILQKYSKTLL